MIIEHLILWTDRLAEQRDFYVTRLGLHLLDSNDHRFTVRAGWTEISFLEWPEKNTYHFCFLIPANQLDEAQSWLSERTPLIPIEPGRVAQDFPDWEATSIYFHDPAGNLLEFIDHRTLDNASEQAFSAGSLLGVNEIGLPVSDIAATDELLTRVMCTTFWKGDRERFGTHGGAEGRLLLPNDGVKTTWFPTATPVQRAPLGVHIRHGEGTFAIDYQEGKLTVVDETEWDLRG